MKRGFYKVTVLCMLTGSVFLSGCEGLNPAADFMKIQAADAQSRRETEAEVQMNQETLASQERQQREQNRHDEAMAANEAAAETQRAQAGMDPSVSGTISEGSNTAEQTAQASVGDDESNDDLQKNN